MPLDHLAASKQTDNERAARILAAARDLLLAWGYKRVTVDEIARRARIGKGTVYLHWKTKEVLFAELLRREFHDVMGLVADRIEQDPATALPGRLVREVYRQQVRRPLARAIHISDGDMLGALATTADGHPVAQELGHHALLAGLVEVWRKHALLVTGASAADQIYVIDTVLSGFLTGGVATPAAQIPAPERRADLLGQVIKGAVEPSVTPSEVTLRAAAQDVLAVLAATQAATTGTSSRS
ncbi:TetR/AcrR family transcriptional regulator [Streptomyces scopuliridis]|uniref:TetR/AcrR family transcriptional regulator n=1 Tax=Streptomyces scopuliridis TaxID=452529 RepID=UPI0036C2D44B